MNQLRTRNLGISLCILALLALSTGMSGARAAGSDAPAQARQAGVPVFAVVGLRRQKITVYDSEGAILRASVSSGQREYETPAGFFTILQKKRDHQSNLYDDAEMPFMQRLTWSGIALHAGPLPGYRASHGCVRLPYGFAEQLFALTAVGTRVVIAPKDVAPKKLAHPVLAELQQAGAGAASIASVEAGRQEAARLRQEAEAIAQRAAEVTTSARRAEAAKAKIVKRLSAAVERAAAAKEGPAKARAEAELQKLRGEASSKLAAAAAAQDAAKAVLAEQTAAEQRAREARLRTWPTSILISRKTGRLYVRQGFEPVLEVPIAIRDAGRPIGSHAVYATETPAGERGWTGLSLAGGPIEEALARIDLPDDVARLLAAGVWLGSTLIITDEAPYKETGPGTDFIVVLSSEPQGALKIRTPGEDRLVSDVGRPGVGDVRAYRATSDDAHFRHPLGSFP